VFRFALSWFLGLIGAVLGGVVGYFAFVWILKQGFYAGVLPGAMIGIGCGMLARHPSLLRGVLCGLAGLAFGFWCEWKTAPFKKDESLDFFLRHIPDLSPVAIIMIALGGLVSYWSGKVPMRGSPPSRDASAERR